VIHVRAELTGSSGGKAVIEIDGHQGAAADGDGRICAYVSAATDTFVALMHALAQQFPDALSVTITERE
jgi:uncharacterized protein YsxB (DUF464 family)